MLMRSVGGGVLLLLLVCWVCTQYVTARLA
jgi:hypothetical protein